MFSFRILFLLLVCCHDLVSSQGFTCPRENGQFADEKSCRRFYQCANNVAYPFFCASGSLYDGARHECVGRHEDVKCGPQPTTEATTTTADPNAPQPCNKKLCNLPYCYCSDDGTEIPGGLTKDQTPQMIMLTFDGAVNNLNYDEYQSIFNQTRVNPNGCPIRGTFFITHDYCDYAKVEELYSQGHEMAVASVSRRTGLEDATEEEWAGEMVTMREILANFAFVNKEEVIGMRAPHLKPGKNAQYNMIYGYGFDWDSSFAIPPLKTPVWPYTLEYKIPHECRSGTCPTSSFLGIWEIPMNSHYKDTGYEGGYCPYLDQCVLSFFTAEDVFQWLKSDFHRYYDQNRAPYMMSLSINWFNDVAKQKGLLKFIDYTLSLPDVWYTTVVGALQWITQPLTVEDIKRLMSDENEEPYLPFACPKEFLPPPPCSNPTSCPLTLGADRLSSDDASTAGTRYMVTCANCPPSYPWVFDASGRGGVHKDTYKKSVPTSK